MIARLCLFLCLSVFAVASAHAQGTFVYDQQSSTDETPFPGAGPTLQQYASYGQTFAPTLSSIDFIRLKLSDNNPTNGLGATLFVNLLSGPTNGILLGSTVPVFLPNGFAGTVNFFLSSSLSLTPGAGYYFEPIVQSGDQWNIDAGEYLYPGGNVFFNGLPAGGSDVWFREGIVVPEPATPALLVVGLGVIAYLKKRCGPA